MPEQDSATGESDEEDNICGMAFMFDAQHHKALHHYEFAKDISIELKMISDSPGHVQSGQYLWPAAIAASNYLIENWHKGLQSPSVLELGAGCGLTGIIARKLQQIDGDCHGTVVFTDYDPGSLELISQNIELNCPGLSTETTFLSWGESIPNELNCPVDGFHLLIGADLVYCIGVVQPLFETVSRILHKKGKFLLVTSFSLEDSIEAEINGACKNHRLIREEKIGLDENGGISRVELYCFY